MTPQRVVLNTDPGVSAVKRRDTDPEGDPDSDPALTQKPYYLFSMLYGQNVRKNMFELLITSKVFSLLH